MPDFSDRTKPLAPESRPFNWRWPNFTLADYNRLLDAQDGGCAITGCTREPKTRRFSVDHDHETGRVRGILCHVHNRRLWAGATAGELRAMAAYLEDATHHGLTSEQIEALLSAPRRTP